MDDKKAANILLAMLKKYQLTAEEEEAIHSAVGFLSWTMLAQSRIKNIKDKRKINA